MRGGYLIHRPVMTIPPVILLPLLTLRLEVVDTMTLFSDSLLILNFFSIFG